MSTKMRTCAESAIEMKRQMNQIAIGIGKSLKKILKTLHTNEAIPRKKAFIKNFPAANAIEPGEWL